MQALFKILGEPHRYAMVRLLLRESLHVQAVADALEIPQPAVSRHARILADAGFLVQEREGRFTRLRCPPDAPSPEVGALLELVCGAEGLVRRWPGRRPDPAAARMTRSGGNRPAEGGEARRPAPVNRDDLEDFLL